MPLYFKKMLFSTASSTTTTAMMMASKKMWRVMPSQYRWLASTTTTTQPTSTVATEGASSSSSSSSSPSSAMERAKERAAERAVAEAKREELLQHARQELGRYRQQRPSNESVLAMKRQTRSRLNHDLRVQLMVGALLIGLIAVTPSVGRHLATTKQKERAEGDDRVYIVPVNDGDNSEGGDGTEKKNESGAAEKSSGSRLTFGQVLLAQQEELHEKARRGELSVERLQEMRSYLPDSFDEYMPEPSNQKTMSNDVYTKWRPKTETDETTTYQTDTTRRS